jgi:hypothetical protein
MVGAPGEERGTVAADWELSGTAVAHWIGTAAVDWEGRMGKPALIGDVAMPWIDDVVGP